MTVPIWPYADIPPRPAEALLIECLPRLTAQHVLCTSLGRAQFAWSAAAIWPHAQVHCSYLDQYQTQLATKVLVDKPANLTIGCAADFPEGPFDLAALPTTATGEAELTRDLLQTAHERLVMEGRMIVATDNSRDSWLQGELAKLFVRVERHNHEQGVVYLATKDKPLKKRKEFSCEFAFRDAGRLIQAKSRPGVFSHRHVDPGARRLMEAMHVEPASRVLDIGCGWGAVALAAACRATGGHVLAIDSNARAVECTEHNAGLNGLTNLSTRLTAGGECDEPESYDLVLANPPYFGGFRIAELFLTAGLQALRPGGRVIAVTKLVDWYLEHMPRWYDGIEVIETKGYYLLQGVKA